MTQPETASGRPRQPISNNRAGAEGALVSTGAALAMALAIKFVEGDVGIALGAFAGAVVGYIGGWLPSAQRNATS